METSISGANHAVLHAQSDRCGLGSTETINSDANHAVLHAQNDRWGLVARETCNSGAIVSVWVHKTPDEGWET